MLGAIAGYDELDPLRWTCRCPTTASHSRRRYAAISHELSLYPLSKSANYRKHLKQLIELYVKTKQEWYVSEAILGGCRVRRHDD
jgi:hypothetical protein